MPKEPKTRRNPGEFTDQDAANEPAPALAPATAARFFRLVMPGLSRAFAQLEMAV
jgi:hypothetical protein